ncbi:MAG: hypothetical protein NTV62_03555 [Candidatus Gribaldobacteria bacterium]|nr:hypothetical protein [Candidatus Gribaldobacteria bacterium]
MATENSNEILDLYEVLPPKLQTAIFSDKTADLIRELAGLYSVPPEKISRLAELIGQSLMGLLSPTALPQSFQEQLKISAQTAQSLTQAFMDRLLSPLQEWLQVFYTDYKFPPMDTTLRHGVKGETTIAEQDQQPTSLAEASIPTAETPTESTTTPTPTPETPNPSDTYRESF